jgi:hypothetical protein
MFSLVVTSSELLFTGHNDTHRQRYIGWRLWSLQKPTGIPSEPKFYLQETYSEQDEYSDDDDDDEEYISNAFNGNTQHTNSIPMMTQILPKENKQDDEEITLHHCPSHFNNLNLFMLN